MAVYDDLKKEITRLYECGFIAVRPSTSFIKNKQEIMISLGDIRRKFSSNKEMYKFAYLMALTMFAVDGIVSTDELVILNEMDQIYCHLGYKQLNEQTSPEYLENLIKDNLPYLKAFIHKYEPKSLEEADEYDTIFSWFELFMAKCITYKRRVTPEELEIYNDIIDNHIDVKKNSFIKNDKPISKGVVVNVFNKTSKIEVQEKAKTNNKDKIDIKDNSDSKTKVDTYFEIVDEPKTLEPKSVRTEFNVKIIEGHGVSRSGISLLAHYVDGGNRGIMKYDLSIGKEVTYLYTESMEKFESIADIYNHSDSFSLHVNKLYSKDKRIFYFMSKDWLYSSKDDIIIPYGVELIKPLAFSQIRKIKRIFIPDTVKKIERYKQGILKGLGVVKIYVEEGLYSRRDIDLNDLLGLDNYSSSLIHLISADRYQKDIYKYEKEKYEKNKDANLTLAPTFDYQKPSSRAKNIPTNDKVVIALKDIPVINPKKKNTDYGFTLDNKLMNVKELVLPEGLVHFDIDSEVDPTKFALERIHFPSTLSVTNILPELIKFKKLMFVFIKPEKKIQLKFENPRFVIANMKKKKGESLFYVYGSGGIETGLFNGVTYVSAFKEEKLIHYLHAYYYLIEDSNEKAYKLLKTDDISDYVLPKSIDNIPVKYIDYYCFSNVKNLPYKKYEDKYGRYALNAYCEENGLTILDD